MSTKYLSSVDLLRNLSVETNSEFSRKYGSGVMRWNRKYATGISRAFEISEGISVISHDCIFVDDFIIKKDRLDSDSIYFMYCLNGQIYHKFQNDEEYEIIEQRQNIIIQSNGDNHNEILFPKNTKIQVSNIFVIKNVIDRDQSKRSLFIKEGLEEVLHFVGKKKPYRFFGSINSRIVQYAQLLYVERNLNFVTRLIMEGAALNVLANQISAHANEEDNNRTTKLTDNDLKSVLELSDFIGNNLDKSLTMKDFKKYAGLSSSKIQRGFKYFFDETVNQFVRNARMAKAKELIELTKLSISEISYMVGISSRSYFSKEFANHFGVSPKHYKQSLEFVKPHFELTYHSTASDNISENIIFNILEEARTFNSKHNISGCLLFHDGGFFQILEGTQEDILNLYARIKNDQRHFDVETVWKGYKAYRSFNDWSMGYIDEQAILDINETKKLKKFDFLKILEKEKSRLMNKKMFWQQVKNHIAVYMESA